MDPLETMWPGSQEIRAGTYVMRVVYVKTSLCLSLPVCDQAIGSRTFGMLDGKLQK